MIVKAFTLAVLLSVHSATFAQARTNVVPEQSTAKNAPGPADVAMAQYYICVKTYALRFTKTVASAGDIADAALSNCMPQAKALTDQAVKMFGTIEPAHNVVDGIVVNARRFAIQSVLEARYPPN